MFFTQELAVPTTTEHDCLVRQLRSSRLPRSFDSSDHLDCLIDGKIAAFECFEDAPKIFFSL